MKQKQHIGKIRLVIEAGKANPAPPVGPALGQRGLNIMDFCKKFNEECGKDKELKPGTPVTVDIYYYQDKSFRLVLHKPPVSVLIKEATSVKSGAKKPGFETVASIGVDKIRQIAVVKLEDMGFTDVNDNSGKPREEIVVAAMKMVAGTARSMGIKVEGEI